MLPPFSPFPKLLARPDELIAQPFPPVVLMLPVVIEPLEARLTLPPAPPLPSPVLLLKPLAAIAPDTLMPPVPAAIMTIPPGIPLPTGDAALPEVVTALTLTDPLDCDCR